MRNRGCDARRVDLGENRKLKMHYMQHGHGAHGQARTP